jgi:adenosyl cobinamide kinase/adenosyl cobinamide phosphate guanylyltransferase
LSGSLTLVIGAAYSGKSRFALQLDPGRDGIRQLRHDVQNTFSDASRAKLLFATLPQDDVQFENERQRIEAMGRQEHCSELLFSPDLIGQWQGVAAYLEAQASAAQKQGKRSPVVIADSLNQWLAWQIYQEQPKCGWSAAGDLIVQRCKELSALIHSSQSSGVDCIVVTLEAGATPPPARLEARVFRKALGVSNQILAAAADHVFAIQAGLPLVLKGPKL